jgi:hypothetical protein
MIIRRWAPLFRALVLGMVLLPDIVSAEDALVSVPRVERVTIATQLYNAGATYYAHSKGAPDFDLDKDYRIYLGQILGSDDRRNCSLASAAFFGQTQYRSQQFL